MKKVKDTKWFRMVGYFTGKLNDYHISAYASSAAFFTFLSLIPLVLLFFTIIPYTPITESTIMKVVSMLIPKEYLPLSIRVITEMYHKKAALLSVSLLVTLWSSAKGMLALIRGLNVISEVKERRNYFLLRLRACVYTIIMMMMLILMIVIVVFGEKIMVVSKAILPNISFFFDFLIQIRMVFVIGILVLFLWALYFWLPSNIRRRTRETIEKQGLLEKEISFEKNCLREKGCMEIAKDERRKHALSELPGSVFTAFAWYLASWLFSEYVNRFSGFSTYGSMATIVIVMFWLYMCFYILFVGAIMNKTVSQIVQNVKLIFKKENRSKIEKE